MSVYFLDTSALAKRYLPEPGTAWIRTLTRSSAGHTLVVSDLTSIELASVIGRSLRNGTISTSQHQGLWNTFLLHAKGQYRTILIGARVKTRAQNLLATYPLRTLDAIQLASALAAERSLGFKPIFLSGDQRLLNCAVAEGFTVDDPYQHP